MTFNSFEVVFYTAAFLVPGFVWSAILSMLLPARDVPAQIRVIEFLTLSCINHGFWSWALFLIFTTGFVDAHPYWSGIFLFGIIFLSPVAFGFASGMLQQKQGVALFLRRLGLNTVHPIRRAWDWHFSRLRPYWVVVTLKDGSRVFGLYGQRSFASSDAQQRDLYIEAQFQPVESGDWAPVEDSGGVLVSGDQIVAIEFRRLLEVSYD